MQNAIIALEVCRTLVKYEEPVKHDRARDDVKQMNQCDRRLIPRN